MLTREDILNMSDWEFDKHLKNRQQLKPYLDRYYKDEHWKNGTPFEEWVKVEIREEKLKQLGI